MVTSLILLAGPLSNGAADPPVLWLAIAASSTTLAPSLKTTGKLRSQSPQAAVVASSDCENLRQGLYLSVAVVAGDRATSQAALEKARAVSADAYVRECRPRPGSRILLGVPLIDPSIEKVPEDVVNWSDADRISTIVKLPEEGYLWLRRIYVAAPEDPLEGRRTSVLFFATDPKKSTQLTADCTDPGFAEKSNRIALSCARETAADNLLHETTVYDATSARALIKVSRCRKPELISVSQLTCWAEEVDGQGVLYLRPKRVPLQ